VAVVVVAGDNSETSRMGTMRHVVAVVRIAAAIISL